MPSGPNELGKQVIEACLAMGFALAGVAPAAPTSRRREYLEWLGAGKHGEMAYLAELLDERLDVGRFLPGARSLVVVADRYARSAPEAGSPDDAGAHGTVARYARGRDYHAVVKRRLHLLCDRLRAMHSGGAFKTFVDTGAVLEREHAARAGLGFIGKHTLLVSPRAGSYLLLGGLATTLELSETAIQGTGPAGAVPAEPVGASVGRDHCGSCTLCIDACPTGAIAPWSVDARRCVSYLTLEHRGEIDPQLHAGMGSWLIGCDVCQDVCPFNQHPDAGRVNPSYGDDGTRARLPVLEVMGWAEADRTRILGGSAGKRATLGALRRNAVIVAGNALAGRDDPELRSRVQAIAKDGDEDPVVRATAARVVETLRSGNCQSSTTSP